MWSRVYESLRRIAVGCFLRLRSDGARTDGVRTDGTDTRVTESMLVTIRPASGGDGPD